MAANYEHLSYEDVGNAVFERYGLKNSSDKETEQLPKKCNICDKVNPYDATICSKCGKYLDLKIAIMHEEEENQEKEKTQQKLEELEKTQKKILEDLEFFKQRTKDD